MPDSLGDRIKRYESVSNHHLTPRSPLLIRVDGRAFHTYTKGFRRPFDSVLMGAMVGAAIDTSRDMQGFKLAYTQSDEATFLLTDYDDLDTQGWFGSELNKVVSLSASLFTAHFNRRMPGLVDQGRLATFDARAFNVPRDDAPNVFIWRQQDWHRNSLQMLAGAHFSHKELQGKKQRDMHDMLHGVGVNWAHLQPREKDGTFILRDRTPMSLPANYALIDQWIST
jgi:tRNA(His) 5'-end guanylyltransferase